MKTFPKTSKEPYCLTVWLFAVMKKETNSQQCGNNLKN